MPQERVRVVPFLGNNSLAPSTCRMAFLPQRVSVEGAVFMAEEGWGIFEGLPVISRGMGMQVCVSQ